MFSLEEAEFEPVSADCQVSKLPLCCHHGPKLPGTKVTTLCHLQSLAFLCISKVPDNIMMLRLFRKQVDLLFCSKEESSNDKSSKTAIEQKHTKDPGIVCSGGLGRAFSELRFFGLSSIRNPFVRTNVTAPEQFFKYDLYFSRSTRPWPRVWRSRCSRQPSPECPELTSTRPSRSP